MLSKFHYLKCALGFLGAILELIEADKTEINSYAKLILQQILCKISPEVNETFQRLDDIP